MWKDERRMCAVKFLRLEDFLYDRRQEETVILEPQGVLFANVCDHVYVSEWVNSWVPDFRAGLVI